MGFARRGWVRGVELVLAATICLSFSSLVGEAAEFPDPDSLTAEPGDRQVRVRWVVPPDSQTVVFSRVSTDPASDEAVNFEILGSYTGCGDRTYRFKYFKPIRTGHLDPSADDTLGITYQVGTRQPTLVTDFRDTLSILSRDSVWDTLVVDCPTCPTGVETVTTWSSGPYKVTGFSRDLGQWTGESRPVVVGFYTADHNKLFTFIVLDDGVVGGDEYDIEIMWEDGEGSDGIINIGQAHYVPGDTLNLIDGLALSFTEGRVRRNDVFRVTGHSEGLQVRIFADSLPSQASFEFSVEGFEGFRLWRREVLTGAADAETSSVGFKYFGECIKCDTLGTVTNPCVRDDRNWSFLDQDVVNGVPYQYAVSVVDHGYPAHPDSGSGYPEDDPRDDRTSIVVAHSIARSHLDLVKVVPNPYKAWEPYLENFDEGRRIQFTNLPEKAVIRIYTVAGDHIDTIEHDGSLTQSGSADWDLRNTKGEEVVSGIYLYKVESPVGDTVGRFMIIR